MARKPAPIRCAGRRNEQWMSLTHCLNYADHEPHDIDVHGPYAPTLYRVTTVRTGEGRRTQTVGLEELRWLEGAWYVGIRVTSYRRFIPTRPLSRKES